MLNHLTDPLVIIVENKDVIKRAVSHFMESQLIRTLAGNEVVESTNEVWDVEAKLVLQI